MRVGGFKIYASPGLHCPFRIRDERRHRLIVLNILNNVAAISCQKTAFKHAFTQHFPTAVPRLKLVDVRRSNFVAIGHDSTILLL